MNNHLGSKHPRVLRDRTLSALGVVALLLLSFAANAQVFPPPSTSWSAQPMQRTSTDSAMYGPTGCGVPTDSTYLFSIGFGHAQILNKYAQYYDSCGHKFYLWDPSLKVWHQGDGGAGGSDSGISVLNGIFVNIVGSTRYMQLDSGTYATRARLQKIVDSLNADTSANNPQAFTTQASRQKLSDSLVALVTPKLAAISTANSVAGNGTSGSPVQLAGDVPSPGNSYYYGTNGSGAKGYNALPSGITLANPTAQISATVVNGSAVTAMRSDAAPAIAVNAVTNSLLAQSPANTIKGNNTGSAANPADLTISQVQTMLAVGNATSIQGVTVSATAPTANQVMQLIGGIWTPQTISTGTVDTTQGHTGAIATISKVYRTVDSAVGVPFNLYVQRSSPRGDSLLHGYQNFLRTPGIIDSLHAHHIINGDSSWTWYVTDIPGALYRFSDSICETINGTRYCVLDSAGGGGSGSTNLGFTPDVENAIITSSTGSPATIPHASYTQAGTEDTTDYAKNHHPLVFANLPGFGHVPWYSVYAQRSDTIKAKAVIITGAGVTDNSDTNTIAYNIAGGGVTAGAGLINFPNSSTIAIDSGAWLGRQTVIPGVYQNNSYEYASVVDSNSALLGVPSSQLIVKAVFTSGWAGPGIYYAESLDSGKTWVYYTGNPIIPGYCRADMHIKGDSLIIDAVLASNLAAIDRFASLHSGTPVFTVTNFGIVSEGGGATSFKQNGVDNCHVEYDTDSSAYYMIVEGLNGNLGYQLGVLKSTDDVHYSMFSSINGVLRGSGPMFKKINGTWYLWYDHSPFTSTGFVFLPSDIFRASSPDLLHWTVSPTEPVIKRISTIDSPYSQVADPFIMPFGNSVFCFFEEGANGGVEGTLATGLHIVRTEFPGTLSQLVATRENASTANTWQSISDPVLNQPQLYTMGPVSIFAIPDSASGLYLGAGTPQRAALRFNLTGALPRANKLPGLFEAYNNYIIYTDSALTTDTFATQRWTRSVLPNTGFEQSIVNNPNLSKNDTVPTHGNLLYVENGTFQMDNGALSPGNGSPLFNLNSGQLIANTGTTLPPILIGGGLSLGAVSSTNGLVGFNMGYVGGTFSLLGNGAGAVIDGISGSLYFGTAPSVGGPGAASTAFPLIMYASGDVGINSGEQDWTGAANAALQSSSFGGNQLGLYYTGTKYALFKVDGAANLNLSGVAGFTMPSAALGAGVSGDSLWSGGTSSGTTTLHKLAIGSGLSVVSGALTATGSSGTLFAQTANGTAIVNTTSAGALIGTGTGSLTIPANTMAVGQTYVLHGFFNYGQTGTPTITFNPLIGSTGYSFGTTPNSGSVYGEIEITYTVITTGTSGTVTAEAKTTYSGTAPTYAFTSGTLTVNTTSTIAFGLTAAWSAASSSNSIQSVPSFTLRQY